MSYDFQLAERIRQYLAQTPAVTERKMFGGLAFLVGGNMAVAANRSGGLMVRVGQEATDDLLASTSARQVEMRGRPMRGWLDIDIEHVASEHELSRWIDIGAAFAETLPPKP